MTGCTLTHIGSFGARRGSYETTFASAFATAVEWVGKQAHPLVRPALELRCHQTGTLYRIKAKALAINGEGVS